MIKNKEDFKKYNIICTSKKEVYECMSFLEKLGFNVEKSRTPNNSDIIVKHYDNVGYFTHSTCCNETNKNISFYRFKKLAKKFFKEEEMKEEKKLEDFEVANDGRITKVNNWESGKKVFLVFGNDNVINGFKQSFLETYIKLGLIYATKETRDKAMFKLEIETKLKNIAERLNNEEKIDWKNNEECKYYIYYDFKEKTLDFNYNLCHKQQGCIYCLSEDFFFDEAKKEIGEENLIKYFED